MSPAPGQTAKPLTQPRPGHADLAGMQKYGLPEARDVLERASARETAARVAVGALCKLMLRRARHRDREPCGADGGGLRQVGTPAGAGRPGGGGRLSRPLLRRRGRGGDGRGGQGRGQRRGLARGRGRGHRLRCTGWPGQPRSLGPQDRWAAGSGADEHPRREGGGDRRGHRGVPGCAVRWPTTRSDGTPCCRPTIAGFQPRRRGRRRHHQRGAGGGPVLHETPVHPQPARPEDGGRGDQGGNGLFQGAHRPYGGAGHGRSRRDDDGLVLAAEALRKFGGDSLLELVRNRDGYLAGLRC